MIRKLHISGIHSKLTKDSELYAQKKIGGLERFIPQKSRESASCDVVIKELKVKDKKRFECEVIVGLPHTTITVREKAETIPAAIDIAENNLKVQLKRYKEKHGGPQLHKRILHRIKRGPQRTL